MLLNKNIIITGTNRGIGKAILEQCALCGANIYAHARKENPEFTEYIEELKYKHNIEIWPIYFDLTDYSSMKSAIKSIIADKRTIDGLVNNAGITYNALFQMSSETELRQQFEVNFFSIFLFTQYISKIMIRQKSGSIVNIASTAALDGNSGKSVYGASKAAVICMTKSIAEELGSYNIRANCIAPGITETDMLSSMSKEIIEQSIRATDLKKVGLPKEISETVTFLISDLSSYITGQTLRVDGGLK